ncbi:MAG TPA: DoxX family membrane protein [Pseudolabrys sp.]|nr:DoxX family membrane protein [Pseudolabrys sp.]
MSDKAAANRPTNQNPGAAAMSRLADRIAAVTPPPPVLDLINPVPATPPRPSPAVAAALATTAALAARADARARRSRRSITALIVEGLVALFSFIPYAVVALGIRLIMARVFFLDGQMRIDGPRFSQSAYGFEFSAVLPTHVRPDAINDFLHYTLPIPPVLTAYLVTFGEFILPIMLVIGIGARFAALGLLALTVLLQLYVTPTALWTTHVYWAALLLVIMSRGPGALSVDHFIKLASRG